MLQSWWQWCPVRMSLLHITSGPSSTLFMWALFPIFETRSTQGPLFHEVNLTAFTWHLSVGVVTGGSSAQVRSHLCFSHYGWALLMTPPQQKVFHEDRNAGLPSFVSSNFSAHRMHLTVSFWEEPPSVRTLGRAASSCSSSSLFT